MRIAIIGAGLAGPLLAVALRQAGWEVALFERDPAAAARGQGYRIHIAPDGVAALRQCLPPDLYELAVATAGKPGSGVTIFDAGLKVLHRMTSPPGEVAAHLTVDRLVLRQILLSGLGDAVRFGADFAGYEAIPGGGVRARFADGTVAEADVLVGADGPRSRVRAQLLPAAQVVGTGQVAIFGKIPLDGDVAAMVPPEALDGFTTVVGADGSYLPLAGHRFRTDPAAAAARCCPGLRFHDTRDYVMVVYGTAAPAVPTGDLLARIAAGVAGWHPAIAELVRRIDPATLTATAIRTALPVAPWPSGPVTLVGDAVHCMVPAGIGAAVALRDAALLARRLIEAGADLIPAIHAYEAEMLVYGFEAVAASQRPLGG